ncbi:hypothetical protein BKA69DRAFT_872813 [Paraphysoderma sedebokerense]|nr:hypothetical protein BKA69DRAFT_872813 [Paraphysoderma sedebokerense]
MNRHLQNQLLSILSTAITLSVTQAAPSPNPQEPVNDPQLGTAQTPVTSTGIIKDDNLRDILILVAVGLTGLHSIGWAVCLIKNSLRKRTNNSKKGGKVEPMLPLGPMTKEEMHAMEKMFGNRSSVYKSGVSDATRRASETPTFASDATLYRYSTQSSPIAKTFPDGSHGRRNTQSMYVNSTAATELSTNHYSLAEPRPAVTNSISSADTLPSSLRPVSSSFSQQGSYNGLASNRQAVRHTMIRVPSQHFINERNHSVISNISLNSLKSVASVATTTRKESLNSKFAARTAGDVRGPTNITSARENSEWVPLKGGSDSGDGGARVNRVERKENIDMEQLMTDLKTPIDQSPKSSPVKHS